MQYISTRGLESSFSFSDILFEGYAEDGGLYVPAAFPKGHSLDEVTEEQLQRVVDLINNRPRRILDYETPQEVFNRALNYQQRRIQSQNLSPV